MADKSGVELSGASCSWARWSCARVLRREVLGRDRSASCTLGRLVLANAALTLDRRVAVDLNYTVSSDVMNQCIARAALVTC